MSRSRSRAGERVGVAGRTGAGKSTLALAAAGFIPRVVRARLDGRVAITGRRHRDGGARPTLLGQGRDRLRDAGQPAVGLEADGARGARLRAREPRRARATRWTRGSTRRSTRLGIVHLADREPFALSGGEQQRVAIASIVAMGTTLLVLDEPTAQLDPAGTDVGRRPARRARPRRHRDPVRRARPGRPRADGSMPRARGRTRRRARRPRGRAGQRARPVGARRRRRSSVSRRRPSIDLGATPSTRSAIAAGLLARRGVPAAALAPSGPARRSAARPRPSSAGRPVASGRPSASRSRGSSIATRRASRPSAACR